MAHHSHLLVSSARTPCSAAVHAKPGIQQALRMCVSLMASSCACPSQTAPMHACPSSVHTRMPFLYPHASHAACVEGHALYQGSAHPYQTYG